MSEIFEQRRDLIIKKFTAFPQWEDRFRLVVDYGKKLKPLPEPLRIDTNLVQGCLSKVWVFGERVDGQLILQADADSAIVKGMVGILVFLYSGLEPDDILSHPADFLRDLGLEQAVSTNRRNGLLHMIAKIRAMAESG